MDPGSIVSIIEACHKGIGLFLKVKDALRGDATSKQQLEELESRLHIIDRALEEVAKVPSLLGSSISNMEQLKRTLEDCNKMLREYQHALSDLSNTKANYQRVKLALYDQEKFKTLNERLDRHRGDLHLLLSTIQIQRNHIQSSADAGSLLSMARPIPYKSNTMITDASDTTLFDRSPMLAEFDAVFGSSEGRALSPTLRHDASVSLGTSPSSSHGDPLEISQNRPDRPAANSNNPWANSLNGYRQSRSLSRQPSEDLDASRLQATPAPARPAVPHSISSQTASPASNVSLSGEVKLFTPTGAYIFPSGSYTVQLQGDYRIVEWSKDGCVVQHLVPLGNTGIPFTRPYDKTDVKKEHQLQFAPPSALHRLQITDSAVNHGVCWVSTLHHYTFSSRTVRQRFQEAIRGSTKMVSFRGMSVTAGTKQNKLLARDVNIKIWTYEDKRSTLSFVRNQGDHGHEEVNLQCFQDYKDASKDSRTVTLRVRKPDGTPEASSSRRPSFRIPFKPRSDSSDQAASRRSSMNSTVSIDTNEPPPPPLPDGLQKIEWLRLEFEDKRGVRADFCRFWTEAYLKNPLSLTFTEPGFGTSRQSASPHQAPRADSSFGSQPPSPVVLSGHGFHSSPRLTARSPGGTVPTGHGEWFPHLGPPIREESSPGLEMMVGTDAQLTRTAHA